MVRVYLVLPDLSLTKAEALCSVGEPLDVLISYSTILWKPVVEERIRLVKDAGCVGSVMLDSGAYHLARGSVEVDVRTYASYASGAGSLYDLIVAPDSPGRADETVSRTLLFSRFYRGGFVPVLQPPHAKVLDELYNAGVIERALRLEDGRLLLGIGGLDGGLRKVEAVSGIVISVVEAASGLGLDVALHLFGVGARILRGLARRGLLDSIYSVDSSGWLAEIRFRRRSVYGAMGVVDANVAAIKGYLERVKAAVAG